MPPSLSPRALPNPAESPSEISSVDDLLRVLRASLPAELAERVRTGAAPGDASTLPRLATGIPALDALLGGGFPRGRLSEITGPLSSGRTALAHALVAAATRNGEIVAVVDASDAFDPESAAAAGIDLARVLWARPPRPREALRCAERLLEARGFGVVVLDQDVPIDSRAGESIWLRMSRSATASGTALVLLASSTRAGPFAALNLEARSTRVHFAAQPAWLEALHTHVVPVRTRIGGITGSAALVWATASGLLNVKTAG